MKNCTESANFQYLNIFIFICHKTIATSHKKNCYFSAKNGIKRAFSLIFVGMLIFFLWKQCVFSYELNVLKSHGSITTDFCISYGFRVKLHRKYKILTVVFLIQFNAFCVNACPRDISLMNHRWSQNIWFCRKLHETSSKSLNGKTSTTNRRRTDNTMVKHKMTNNDIQYII